MEKVNPDMLQNAGTIIIGLLYLVTETLPFLKDVESNGIAHFFYTLGLSALKEKKKEENEEAEGIDEESQLIPCNCNPCTCTKPVTII